MTYQCPKCHSENVDFNGPVGGCLDCGFRHIDDRPEVAFIRKPKDDSPPPPTRGKNGGGE